MPANVAISPHAHVWTKRDSQVSHKAHITEQITKEHSAMFEGMLQ